MHFKERSGADAAATDTLCNLEWILPFHKLGSRLQYTGGIHGDNGIASIGGVQQQTRVEIVESRLGFDVVRHCMSTGMKVFPYPSRSRIESTLPNKS